MSTNLLGTFSVDAIRHHFDYDAQTGALRWRVPTSPHVKPGAVVNLHVSHRGYQNVSLFGQSLTVHRLAWFHAHGCLPNHPDQVVAKNGDFKDIRLENLEVRSRPTQPTHVRDARRLQAQQQSLWERVNQEFGATAWASFEAFKADVTPAAYHRLVAANTSKPIGPGNWRLERLAKVDRSTPEGRKAYYLAKNKVRKPQMRAHHLGSKFGITTEEYAAMSKAQGDVCAICTQPETAVRLGTPLPLAVDHCHDSGEIRSLLCRDCNHVLGKFKDDAARFRAAADYLDRHAALKSSTSVPASATPPKPKERSPL